MGLKPSGVVIPKTETANNTLKLGDEINKNYALKGLMLPRLVFSSRGGSEIADILCQQLGVGKVDTLQAVVKRVHPASPNADPPQPSKFEIGLQFPTEKQVEDQDLLLIDVVCRSGEKLAFVKSRLIELGASSVKSAVIYDMTPLIDGSTPIHHRPDYVGVEEQRIHSLGYATFHWQYEDRMVELQRQQELHAARQQVADQIGSYLNRISE